MPRILAIDYGIKRTGLAVTDPLQIIASGLTTVASENIFDFLKEYFSREEVSKVLVGEPRQMDYSPSESAPIIEKFVEKFRETFPQMKVVRVDERFTSKLAFDAMLKSGISKKKRADKGLVDEIAATIMLQDYLTRKMF
ncbi:MAG: Holliday junction resolvase RuvX [Flavobacterium sp.]|nr:MAG: Holliday junction resolvase RuvX [Flavobacterium sp.]